MVINRKFALNFATLEEQIKKIPNMRQRKGYLIVYRC